MVNKQFFYYILKIFLLNLKKLFLFLLKEVNQIYIILLSTWVFEFKLKKYSL